MENACWGNNIIVFISWKNSVIPAGIKIFKKIGLKKCSIVKDLKPTMIYFIRSYCFFENLVCKCHLTRLLKN